MSAIVRGSRRSCVRTRTAVAAVTLNRAASTRRRNTSSSARAHRSAPAARRRRPGRDHRALAEQEQLIAALGLVHHVARDDERGALVGEAGGRDPRGRGAAADRARPSARRAPAARASVAASSRATRAPAARPRGCATTLPATEPSDTVVDQLVAATLGDAVQPREVAEVLPHREVGVHRRRLRHVSDAHPKAPPIRPARRARSRALRQLAGHRRSSAAASTSRPRSARASR